MAVTDVNPGGDFKNVGKELLGNRVLFLAPHPDDETLACGGSLAMHSKHQDTLKIVVLTDGRAADDNKTMSNEDYVALRENETRMSLQILGIDLGCLEFWRFEDQKLSANHDQAKKRLGELLDAYRPTLVYSPSPAEHHTDHIAASKICFEAVRESRQKPHVAFYEFNQPVRPNFIADISEVSALKERACDVFSSQNKLHSYARAAMGLSQYRALARSALGCRYAEAFQIFQGRDFSATSFDRFVFEKIALPAADFKQTILAEQRALVDRIQHIEASKSWRWSAPVRNTLFRISRWLT